MKSQSFNPVKKIGLNNFRLLIVLGFFISLLIIIEIRLFSIQVLKHEYYESMARDQYSNVQEITPRRGRIFTSDGYVLAGVEFNYLMYAEPKVVEDKYKVANDLAALMVQFRPQKDISPETTYKEYHDKFLGFLEKNLLWVGLEKNLSPVEKDQIEKLGFKGIGFEEEPNRYYPEGSLASHILGFVASDEQGNKTGYYGIEGKLNEDLRGKSGKVIQELDAKGNPILAGSYKKVEPIEGRDIYLTINRAVQYLIEKKIKEGVEKYDAVSGDVIVMNPMTGTVYAMANYPTYSPGDFSMEEKPDEGSPHRKTLERQNLAISQTYEPGSVIKPITVSAAIDLKLINPNTTYEDNGPVRYSDYVIDNWDGKHYGTMTIIQLLQKSNNIGASWVGTKVGAKQLSSYMKNYGIGIRTGIELEGEDSGILLDYNDWSDIALANISFGQGMSATPLQVVNAFNVMANGGILLEPHVISKLVDDDRETEIPIRTVRRVISKETSDTMVSLLESAATGGEAKFFVLKNYKIAGKTGTAQIPVNGTYDPKKTNATFVGFVSGSKKFSMIVKLEEPRTSPYAAETAVPLWMDIAQELIKYFGLVPDLSTVAASDTSSN